MTFEQMLFLAKQDHSNNFTRPGMIKADGIQKTISRYIPDKSDLVKTPYFITNDMWDNYEVWTPGNEDLFANDWQQI